MKKYLFLLIFLLPISVFAWADTDRICADDAKWGKIYEYVSLAYPGRSVGTNAVYKYFYSTNRDSYHPIWSTKLYYIVDIINSSNSRSELYSYDCESKTPKLLLTLKIHWDNESSYMINYENNGNIILVTTQISFPGPEAPIERIVGYNVYSAKKMFDLNWFSRAWNIDGFIASKNSWYIYTSSEDYDHIGKLYQIDKKTKKITKL